MPRKRKKTTKFVKRMQIKLIVMFLIVTSLLTGLICRLMYIEYKQGDKYEKIVLSQQGYDSRIIPYQRGDIVDAKGTILATSLDVYNVIFDCSVLEKQKKKIVNGTISAILSCFPDLKEDDLRRILNENPKSQYNILLRKLPYEQIQPYVELEADSKKNKNIKKGALWFEKEYIRNYPYGSTAASLIGFVSGGNVGTIGMENYYNSTLNGLNGKEYGYLNSDNNVEKTIREAKDGKTIVSTIDIHIQGIVEEKLAKFNEENTNGYITGPGSKNIAAIVMNPQNGEVLAMAKYPNFDLNNPRDISAYFTEEELQGLTEEQQMELLNDLWENFCVSYTFEPGSTVKPMTVACGLDTGTLNGSETYVCDGEEKFNGTPVHCVSRVGHGTETIEKSLMDSCNDALMQMSYVIGEENFKNYQKIYGFGEKTGIDLPGEERGILFDEMTPIDLATNSFGQNYNCTMIQVASAFSSLINGGQYYQPHVVKKILDSEGNTLETIKPVLLKETASKETSELVKSYLYKTVSEGTGEMAKVNGYSMGGKTGTAQKHPRAEKKYLVSFIGYLPQENPQLVIYVVIDEPNFKEQAHSNYAQAVVKEILEEVLPYMNMYPDEEKKEEPEEGENPQGSQPEGGESPQGNQPEGSGENPQGNQPEEEENPQGSGEEPQENQPESGENPQEGQPEGGGQGIQGESPPEDEDEPQDQF